MTDPTTPRLPETMGRIQDWTDGLVIDGANARAARRAVVLSLRRFLAIVGDPWSVLVLRDVFLGVNRFDAFRERLGVARQTLTDRLGRFCEHQILQRVPYQQRPVRYTYRLTPRGRDLGPFALMIWTWQTRWAGRHSLLPPRLVHRTCGGVLVPQLVCGECFAPVEPHEVEVSGSPGRRHGAGPAARGRRWLGDPDDRRSHEIRGLLRGTYIIGDRWSNLVLASALLGVRSFDEITALLGISTNILAHRLKECVSAGLLAPPMYSAARRRHEYGFTAMTRELFPVFLAISRWSDRWLAETDDVRPEWLHLVCGRPLRPVVTGRCCAGELRLGDIAFDADLPPR